MAAPQADPYADPEERYSYRSALVDRLRQGDLRLRAGRLTVVLPQKFGFCWGVDRALAMVRDVIAKNPVRRFWLVNQIIHNPRVNRDLHEKGVRFVEGPLAERGGFDALRAGDLVFIPAFSVEVEDRRRIEAAGCEVVDTTCPWVIKPHKRASKYVAEGFTTVLHGMVGHDETKASCSLIASEGGHFVVVGDLAETDELCAFLRDPSDPDAFLRRFERALSPGFDAARHLEKIGLINQTTMLASESREVARRVRAAIAARHGEAALAGRFRDFDTICRATQENQDALDGVVANDRPDLLLVVGGYDSSNTKNLSRIGDGREIPAYHVESPSRIERDRIRHRDRRSGAEVETRDWLPSGPVTVAISAGASTPDTILAEAVERVVEAAGERVESAAS